MPHLKPDLYMLLIIITMKVFQNRKTKPVKENP